MTTPTLATVDQIMALVDDYTDAFHAAMRPDGGLEFAGGLVAVGKKAALKSALGALIDALEGARKSERENEDQLCRIAKAFGGDARNAPESDTTIAGFAIAKFKALEAERDALLVDAQNWRAIDTAPTDGTYILVSNEGGVWIAAWQPIATSGYRFDQPWRSVMLNHYHIEIPSRYMPPTHWMPLPSMTASQATPEGKK